MHDGIVLVLDEADTGEEPVPDGVASDIRRILDLLVKGHWALLEREGYLSERVTREDLERQANSLGAEWTALTDEKMLENCVTFADHSGWFIDVPQGDLFLILSATKQSNGSVRVLIEDLHY